MKIKSHSEILRLLFLQDFKQDIQKTVHSSRRFSLGIGKGRHSVECPVQNTVAVN